MFTASFRRPQPRRPPRSHGAICLGGKAGSADGPSPEEEAVGPTTDDDRRCRVDDAATFHTDRGSDRPCARTRSAHVPAKPSGPVRPLSKWAGAWESGQTQLLGARHRRGVRPCGRRCADRSRPPGGRDAMHGGQAGRSAGPGTVLGCPGGGCPREARGGSPLSRCRSRPPCASTALTPGVGTTDTRGGAASSGPAAA